MSLNSLKPSFIKIPLIQTPWVQGTLNFKFNTLQWLGMELKALQKSELTVKKFPIELAIKDLCRSNRILKTQPFWFPKMELSCKRKF